MADTELKPCPFCNNIPTIRIFVGKDGWRDRYAVLCRYDEGGCGAESGLYHYKEEAVEAWNRRAVKRGHWIEHEKFERKNCNVCIECSVCNTWFGHDVYPKTKFCPNCGADMRGESNADV